MRKKFLLGATADREIVFGEFEITHRNGYQQFSASFDCVRPFNGNDYDLEQYFEDWMDGCDKEYLYDLCERHWCSPQDLPGKLADECFDVRDALDCSLYPEEMQVDDDYWYFESSSCGQNDTREEMEEYTNKVAYDLLHKLWDKYHLMKVDEGVEEEVQKIVEMLDDVDEEAWIEDYIRRNF